MSARVWTMDEILSCPDFGGDVGWFYGLVRHDWYLVPAEIFPGLGYAIGWGRNPRWWLVALKDVSRTKHLKARYVGRGGQPRSSVSTEYVLLDDLLNTDASGDSA